MPLEYQACFGCGEDNPAGIRLRDIHRVGDAVHATFAPDPVHCGDPGVVHRGIVAAALDEAMSYSCAILTGTWCLTLKSEFRYLLAVPLDGVHRLQAVVTSPTDRRRYSTAAQFFLPDGRLAVEATALFVAASTEMLNGLVPPYMERMVPDQNAGGLPSDAPPSTPRICPVTESA